MSLMAAIDTAVRLQLAREKANCPQSYAVLMNAAAPGFAFDTASMLQFLEQVSARLRLDTPALRYDWARTDIQKCLNASLLLLVGLIACDTVLADGGKA